MISTNLPLKTKITLTNWNAFNKEISSIPDKNNIINWTKEGVLKAKDLYTTGLMDCSACIITDGEGTFAHIRPTDPENANFSAIEQKILNTLGEKTNNLKGFIIGSVSRYNGSQKVFENFRKFLEDTLKIPYSVMRGHTKDSIDTAVAYKADKNTIFITNDFISDKTFYKKPPSTYLDNAFEEIKIDPCHELIMD